MNKLFKHHHTESLCKVWQESVRYFWRRRCLRVYSPILSMLTKTWLIHKIVKKLNNSKSWTKFVAIITLKVWVKFDKDPSITFREEVGEGRRRRWRRRRRRRAPWSKSAPPTGPKWNLWKQTLRVNQCFYGVKAKGVSFWVPLYNVYYRRSG